MLAAVTMDALHWVAPNKLKNPPDRLEPILDTPELPSAAAWAPDNITLYIAHSNTISKCNPDGLLPVFCLTAELSPISHLVCTDTLNTVIFSADQSVYVLEDVNGTDITPRILGTHKLAVRGLSLSYDSSLVVAISADAAYVHNLASGSQTILRGLPLTPSATRIGACAFHYHTRTRVLLGIGRQLAIYDTLRPSSPVKVIATGDSEIGFIACSPFSKTLVAVASTLGDVTLVDLERDKSIVRTLNVDNIITSLTFSPEGGSIYIGTNDGQLLVLSLRELDRAPKSVQLGTTRSKVVALAVQKKSRSEISARGDSISSKSTATTFSHRRSASRSQPASSRAGSSDVAGPSTASARLGPSISAATSSRSLARDSTPPKAARPVASRTGSTDTTPTMDRQRKPRDRVSPSAKVFTPSKDPLGNRGIPGGSPVVARRAFLNKTGSPLTKSPPAARTRAVPSNVAITHKRTVSGSSRTAAATKPMRSTNEGPPVTARPRAETFSHSTATAPSRASTRSATTKASTSATSPRSTSRTPSPDLPTASTFPETPLASKDKARSKVASTNLLAPSDAWDSAIVTPDSRRVGFLPPTVVPLPASDSEPDSDDECPPQPALAMQISPRRPTSVAWNPSPLRGVNGGAGLGAAGAQDLLRTLVRDALSDVRQESHAEIVGLRLDLLNLGRSWKKELREGLGGLTEEVKLLREENERLREENAKLRRGY